MMSFEIQQAIVDVLVSKTARAAKEFAAKSIIIGGEFLPMKNCVTNETAADELQTKF